MRTQISLGMKLISICLLALNFTLGLASEPVFVEVQSAGSLSSLIEDSQKNQITDLTITGNLNGTDIRFIREMAGRDVEEMKQKEHCRCWTCRGRQSFQGATITINNTLNTRHRIMRSEKICLLIAVFLLL